MTHPTKYFLPLAAADVPKKHAATLAKYRQLASEHGVPETTAVCYRVKAGFTLKSHAAKAGPCNDGFNHLQVWNFPDEPTVDAIVFWVPRVLEGSTSKTKDQQIQFLAALRGKLELPAHHLAGFGNVALVAGLILAHFKATGERVPLDGYWVRTDTCHADGLRLYVYWSDDGSLDCINWHVVGGLSDDLGAFVLGVEPL